MAQCYGRIMKDGEANRSRFPNNRRFFLEHRCPLLSAKGDLCSRCLDWKSRGKTKDLYRAHYGLVTEPLPETCHIFGSAWYEAKVKDYGSPSESEMAKAKQAQQEARKGVEIQAKVEVEVEVEPKPVVKPVAKRGAKKKVEDPIPPPPPPPEPEPQPDPRPTRPDPNPPPPKPASKRRQTKAKVVEPVKAVDVKVPILAVESGPPLKDLEIVKIVVRPFTVNDTAYFRDSAKNKLYSVGKDKRPSSYVGRWNPEEEVIDRDFPDSDAD